MKKKRKTISKAAPEQKQIPKRRDADRRARQNTRLSNSIRILELIQGKGRWNAKALAKEFETSQRTIYRHLAALEMAGVPYSFDESEQCYRVRSWYRFPTINLTSDELIDQATATMVAEAHAVTLRGAKTTTTRLKSAASDENASLLEDIQRLTTVLDLKLADHSRHQETIKTIQAALLEQKQLTGQYASPYYKKPVRLHLHPYQLCFAGQSWYLIARPNDEGAPKTYRVPRFQSLRALQRPSEVSEHFNIDDYFGNAWSVYRGDTEYEVEIEFTPEAAPLVSEVRWHHTQEVKRKYKDGRILLKFTVAGLDEIVWWILGWSGRATVRAPDELRRRVVDQLRAALSAYDTNGGGDASC
ncbi:MAG: WYL domain-containing protein [Pirellulales bacterium]